MFLSLPSHVDGVGNARVRGAVDKPAEDLRAVAVWVGTGQLHSVLAAQATFLHRGGGATLAKALASRAVFVAQPACIHLGGAAVDRPQGLSPF